MRPYQPRRELGALGLAFAGRSSLLHIIGVSVKLTSIETRIATVAVMPNSYNIRPVTLERNETGRKTITSESVVERTAGPISRVPSIEACTGSNPFSSMQ